MSESSVGMGPSKTVHAAITASRSWFAEAPVERVARDHHAVGVHGEATVGSHDVFVDVARQQLAAHIFSNMRESRSGAEFCGTARIF